MTTPAGRHCRGIKLNGEPCGAWATLRSDFCFYHDPDKTAVQKAARSKGGRMRRAPHEAVCLPKDKAPVDLKTPEDMRVLMSETISCLRRLPIDTKVASTIGYLAQIGLKAIEQNELEERLRRIEEKLELESKRA